MTELSKQHRQHCPCRKNMLQWHKNWKQVEAQSKTRGTELGEARAALKKIAHDENVSHLACPGPPNCDHSHYLTCPVQIARDALEKHED